MEAPLGLTDLSSITPEGGFSDGYLNLKSIPNEDEKDEKGNELERGVSERQAESEVREELE